MNQTDSDKLEAHIRASVTKFLADGGTLVSKTFGNGKQCCPMRVAAGEGMFLSPYRVTRCNDAMRYVLCPIKRNPLIEVRANNGLAFTERKESL